MNWDAYFINAETLSELFEAKKNALHAVILKANPNLQTRLYCRNCRHWMKEHAAQIALPVQHRAAIISIKDTYAPCALDVQDMERDFETYPDHRKRRSVGNYDSIRFHCECNECREFARYGNEECAFVPTKEELAEYLPNILQGFADVMATYNKFKAQAIAENWPWSKAFDQVRWEKDGPWYKVGTSEDGKSEALGIKPRQIKVGKVILVNEYKEIEAEAMETEEVE